LLRNGEFKASLGYTVKLSKEREREGGKEEEGVRGKRPTSI
jgi:hypothetical protein